MLKKKGNTSKILIGVQVLAHVPCGSTSVSDPSFLAVQTWGSNPAGSSPRGPASHVGHLALGTVGLWGLNHLGRRGPSVSFLALVFSHSHSLLPAISLPLGRIGSDLFLLKFLATFGVRVLSFLFFPGGVLSLVTVMVLVL